MDIRAIVITVWLSQSLCEGQGRGLATSLLQGLLSSNPQLLKMISNRLGTCGPCGYELQNPIIQGQSGPIQSQIQSGPVIQSQFQSGPVIQRQNYQQIQYSSPQYQVQNVVKDVPVLTKETQTIQTFPRQTTVQQTYPASELCPVSSPVPMVNPFLPAASPVSAICPPTSSLLPPANPSFCRSQYLRKIPIPPPCL